MSSEARKLAVAEYKKRKAIAGIYAVRCEPSGQVWVGRALDMEKIKTRLWFALRTEANQHPAMQAAWRAYGAESFAFEPLEEIEAQDLDFVRDGLLRDRLAYWRAELQADLV